MTIRYPQAIDFYICLHMIYGATARGLTGRSSFRHGEGRGQMSWVRKGGGGGGGRMSTPILPY